MVALQVVPEELRRGDPDIIDNKRGVHNNEKQSTYWLGSDLIEPWDAALLIQSPQRLGGRGAVAVLVVDGRADK